MMTQNDTQHCDASTITIYTNPLQPTIIITDIPTTLQSRTQILHKHTVSIATIALNHSTVLAIVPKVDPAVTNRD